MFGSTKVVKDNDKEKYVHSDNGRAFDRKGLWSLNNYSARNVIIFGTDNSSSSYTNNKKNDFLILGDGLTFRINGSLGSSEKRLVLILVKQRQSFVSVCIIMAIIINSYLFVNGKEIYNLKLVIKMLTFHLTFV